MVSSDVVFLGSVLLPHREVPYAPNHEKTLLLKHLTMFDSVELTRIPKNATLLETMASWALKKQAR